MPKLKTHRGAAKRFRKTSGGKIKRSRAFASHILTKKSTNRKRKLDQPDFVHQSDYRRIRELLPYE